MKYYKYIILDFGGVLYEISHSRTIEEFAKLCGSQKQIIEIVKSDEFNKAHHKFERGRIESGEFRNNLRDFLGIKSLSDNDIDKAWNATLIRLFPYSVQLISHLMEKQNLLLLSNTNKIHYEKFEPECREMFKDFEHLFFSFELGERKPDRNIYQKVLDYTGEKPGEHIFIDDSEENILSARNIGFDAVLLKDASKLSDVLHTVNVV